MRGIIIISISICISAYAYADVSKLVNDKIYYILRSTHYTNTKC